MPSKTPKPKRNHQPSRVLACVNCQKRKLKCERVFPCRQCIGINAKCVQATQAPPPRRVPERDLLKRIRYYESLLRQNKVDFEPLHESVAKKASHGEYAKVFSSPENVPSGSKKTGAAQSEAVYEARDFWHVMNQRSGDSEDDEDDEEEKGEENDDEGSLPRHEVRDVAVKKAFDQLYESNDHFLFGSRKADINLSTLHPEQAHILKLWQIYLNNIDPLLKITHTLDLQAHIINTAGHLTNISHTMEALMFSIYSVSVLSLNDDECFTTFGLTRECLLTTYQFGCQQALLDCGVLRSGDRDCLTALYLYLISVVPTIDPRSLSSMLGVAIRIAQRMGIHSESSYAKCSALEAEMRRRLWWSLAIFDSRIGELSDYKTATLTPTWDCRIPLNLNDFDIRIEMRTLPASHETPTEALFTVVRSELSNFVRYSSFHLDFTNPSLKAIAKEIHQDIGLQNGELSTLETMIEDKYLQFCSPENPLHYMTMWTARGALAKYHLLEHYSKHSQPLVQQTDTQRDVAISYALSMLECDTKLMTSSLTRRYLWLLQFQFPFPAYIHIIQDLRKRPAEQHTGKAWNVLSENYEARSLDLTRNDNPLFAILARIVIVAWEAYEAVSTEIVEPLELPRIVSNIKHKMKGKASDTKPGSTEQVGSAPAVKIGGFSRPMPIDPGDYGPLYGMGEEDSTDFSPFSCFAISEQDTMDLNMDWTGIYWNSMYASGW